MKMKAVAGLAVMVCGSSASGADPPTLTPGSRVRVTAPQVAAEPLIGTLTALEPDAVSVRYGGSDVPRRIPLSAVAGLEVSGGRRSRAGPGALIGLGVGAMPGLLMTFGDYSSDVHTSGPTPGAVAAVGAACGAAVGAAVGWALKSEEWLPAALPSVAVGIAPMPGGGVAVSARAAWGRGRTHAR